MDCSLVLLLSALLPLFSVGTGATLSSTGATRSLSELKNGARVLALNAVAKLNINNEPFWQSLPNQWTKLVSDVVLSSDLSSILGTLGTFQVKLKTISQIVPDNWVKQLKCDISGLMVSLDDWIGTECPGERYRTVTQNKLDDPMARFGVSWSRSELKKLHGFLDYLLKLDSFTINCTGGRLTLVAQDCIKGRHGNQVSCNC